MTFTHLRPSDYRAMPWKDGDGVTTELCIEPPGASLASGFLWRLSMAKVERSGPFSRFPGMDRSLAVLEGGGLDLRVGKANARLLAGGEPVRFAGDDEAYGDLVDGPVLDFNLISDRTRVSHRLSWFEGGWLPPADLRLLFVVSGSAVVWPWGGRLGRYELLRAEGEIGLRIELLEGAQLLHAVITSF